MALITQQETAILRLTQALFNAAPGAIYLKALNEEVLAGQSFTDLAQAIVNSTSFFIENNKHDPFDLFSNQGLVDWSFVIDSITGNNISTANKEWVIDYLKHISVSIV